MLYFGMLLLLLAVLSSAQNAQPCARVSQNTVSNSPPLPTLPAKAFKATIKASILNKNVTVEAREYVDEGSNAATIVLNINGQENRVIMSYATNEIFYIGPNSDTTSLAPGPMFCLTANLSTDDNTQLFGMSSSAPPGQQHLFSTSKILNFMNSTQQYYKGQKMMDGMLVNQWSSCVYWPQLNANFTLDYYFSAAGWQTPSGLDQVPVMAEVQGVRTYPNKTIVLFHHVYQYVNFQPYVSDPETIFATPPGVYCLLRQPVKQPPKLNNHFYYREEIVSTGNSGNVDQETDIWYDYDLQLVRFDQRSAPSGVSNNFIQSNGPFTVIHDYGTGVQYTIARDTQTCSVDPIPMDARGFDGLNNTRSTLSMRNPSQFFNLNSQTFVYAGQRMARGMQCDVFQTLLTTIPGFSLVVYEVYFLAGGQDITDRGSSSAAPQAIPFRINMWADGTLTNQYEIHDFDQSDSQPRNFDVASCFPGQQSIDFELFLTGVTNMALMPQLAPALRNMLTLAVALNSGITPLRVQHIRLHWDQIKVYFQGTLIGAAPSLAKFQSYPGQVMTQGQGKNLQNIATASSCADQCTFLQEWNCNNFDYCPGSQVCVLGRIQDLPTLQNNTGCTHYQRVLGGGSVAEASLQDIWNKLRNNVYQGIFTFPLALPDANGYVDLSKDPSTMDATQKVTFTATDITNKVVSQPNRNGFSSDMKQFTAFTNKEGKGFNDAYRGVSVDDCAGYCVNEQTYNCQSFHYCWDAGSCFISTLHPDERPDMLKDSTGCDVYVRDYTSNFEQFNGISVLSGSNVLYQNVLTASQCAKLCTYYSGYHCESFDYCTDISTCYLGQTHYYNTPKANVMVAPSCIHFSRNYVKDFLVKSQKQIPLRDNRIVVDVNAAQCAKLCVEEGSFQCNSFDYCGNFSECRLSDATVSGTGQVTMDSTAFCDVYIRQYRSTGLNLPQVQTTTTSKPYSSGDMAGLGVPMGLVGIAAVAVGYYFYMRRVR